MKRLLIALGLAVPALALTMTAPVSGQHRQSVWEGAYTNAQADRGVEIYKSKCTTCHGPALKGAIDGGPPLVGKDFFIRWDGATVSYMIEQISSLMPSENPGSLKPQEYVDILAFLFRANGLPAGSKELTADEATLQSWEFNETKP